MASIPCVHILGGGSIGMLTAWHLRHAEIPVTLLLRRPASAQLLRAAGNRIQLEYAGTQAAACPSWLAQHATLPTHDVAVELLPSEHGSAAAAAAAPQQQQQQIRRLIVTTKAADAAPALLSVLRRLSPACQVLLLQNGILGVYQEVYEKVLSLPSAPPAITLLVGSVTHGAFLRSPAHVVHSGMGAIKLAPLDCRLPDLAHPHHQQAWQHSSTHAAPAAPPQPSAPHPAPPSAPEPASGSRPAATPDDPSLLRQLLSVPSLGPELIPDHVSLLRQVHLKLAVNCAINPCTALLGCLNSSLTEDPRGRALVHSVCDELFGLYGAQLLGTGSAPELAEFVLQVASGTGRNRNSMLQDVMAGRPTEVDYLNGYVARWAAQRGRQAPVNALLQQLVKARESLGVGLL